MPIHPIVLQRRHAELGRIRLGDKGSKGQPQKLTQFRFTSPNQRHIEDLARLYGGTARPWRNGTKDEWEVYSEARSVPVIVVKGGISQWLETWSGGGCTHRCDGVTNALTDSPCDPDDGAHQAAKPTTRLSVMLRELDAIGVFRLESHGWNAAAEIPGLVELAMHVGELVPANLFLAERTQIKDGKTSKFVVPGLDLEVSPGRLAAIVSGVATSEAITSGQGPAAIESAPAVDWLGLVEDATTAEECRGIWVSAGEAGKLTEDVKAAITAKVATFSSPGPAPATSVDDLWFLVVAEAGRQDMTDADVRGAFTRAYGHPVEDAQVDELEGFLAELKAAPAEVSA